MISIPMIIKELVIKINSKTISISKFVAQLKMQSTKLTFHDLDINWLADIKLQISQERTTIEEAAKSAQFIKHEQIIQKPISRQTLSKAFTSRAEEIKNLSPNAFHIIKRASRASKIRIFLAFGPQNKRVILEKNY